MDNLETIELFVDDLNEDDGVDALSFVEYPAIEENFIALSKHKVEFKTVDTEKRIIVGLALVPDKKIYRRKGEEEYNVIFSKDTVRKVAGLYLNRNKTNNTTLEHAEFTKDVSVVESWIVESSTQDKTALYGLEAPEGAWAVVMKVNNDEVWADVKAGKYLGLSIEGMFSGREESEEELSSAELIAQITELLKDY